MAIDKIHMTMTLTDQVFDNQHQQRNPGAKNPSVTQQDQKNPNLTHQDQQHNPQSPKTLELDPPKSDPDGKIEAGPNNDDVEMISPDLKSVSDLNQGEERSDFEEEGFEKVETFVEFEEKRMEEENGRLCFDGKSFVCENEVLLRRCNGVDVFGGVGVGGDGDGVESMEFEEEKVIQEVEDGEEEKEGEREEEEGDEEDEEEEEEVEEGEFSLRMGGETSNNLFQGIEAMQVPFGSLLDSLVENNAIQENFSQFEFGNGYDDNVIIHGNKRMVAGNDDNEILYSNKRMRNGGLDFDMKGGGGSDFDMCMERMQHCMGKARMMYAEKEQTCAEASMNQQFLVDELCKREAEKQQLLTSIQRLQHKRQSEVYRYERELDLMADLVKGYREALKETKKTFAEYRRRTEELDEPLYKDVSGGGGLVVSVAELEKQGLKEEEERTNRSLIEKTIKDYEAECLVKFEAHRCAVESLNNRLLDVENQIGPFRELIAKRKVLKSSECDPSE